MLHAGVGLAGMSSLLFYRYLDLIIHIVVYLFILLLYANVSLGLNFHVTIFAATLVGIANYMSTPYHDVVALVETVVEVIIGAV